MKKKLRTIASVLLSMVMLLTAVPTQHVYAAASAGTKQPAPTARKIVKRGGSPTPTRRVTTKPKVTQPSMKPTTSKVGWRAYIITADDENGNTNPRLMEGTDVIDIVNSETFFDDIDAKAYFTRVLPDEEVSRWMQPVVIDGVKMKDPSWSGDIAQWYKDKSNGDVRALTLIAEYWGEATYQKFIDTTEYHFLVMEPLHWSVIVDPYSSTDAPYRAAFGPENKNHMFYGTNYQWLMYLAMLGIDTDHYSFKNTICRKYTLSAMLKDHDWFNLRDGYNNPYSDELVAGRAADFLTIDTQNLGMAIMAFRNDQLCTQSTWDDVSTVPSRAPKESEGTWYIHKTYRTKHLTDTGYDYTGDGQFTLPSVTNTISVEAEPPTGYTVVGWRTSTSDPINPDYNNWEGTIPGVVQANGASNKS